jgi:pimeloyl-ACP methyl ester carboxylesterase
LLWLQETLTREAAAELRREQLEKLVQAAVTVSGRSLRFLYSRKQEYDADLFALQLCTNAGFEPENCLDALRALAMPGHPAAAVDRGPAAKRVASVVSPFDNQSVLLRLKRLRQELDGQPDGGECGLYVFQPDNGFRTRAPDRLIGPGGRGVVIVHGLESDLTRFEAMARALADCPATGGAPILGFLYPNDESLARSARFLKRELHRVCGTAEQVDFVCHSAGGLVVRYYAEREAGGLRRAVFLGTPHAGSRLSELGAFLEMGQLVEKADLGFPETLRSAIMDGRGQMGIDLKPDSLFLRDLNGGEPRAEHYAVIRGRAVRATSGLAFRTLHGAAIVALKQGAARLNVPELLRAMVLQKVDSWSLPEEILRGDLAVSLDSAGLEGVRRTETLPLNHVRLTRAAEAIDTVLEMLAEDDVAGPYSSQ